MTKLIDWKRMKALVVFDVVLAGVVVAFCAIGAVALIMGGVLLFGAIL